MISRHCLDCPHRPITERDADGPSLFVSLFVGLLLVALFVVLVFFRVQW